MPTKIEKDVVTGTPTTGHEWDGIMELNTPLPKWWLWTFYACILAAIVYFILMPAIPLGTSYTKGLLGYSTRGEVEKTLAKAAAAQEKNLTAIKAQSTADIRKNPELATFAVAGGKVLFGDNCAPCHAAGGAGQAGGYPNLADDDWIWGGDLAAIEQTIRYGIRSGNDKGRASEMPKFGADGLLTPAQISDVADYVFSLSNPGQTGESLARGKEVFTEQCASCHAEDGAGLQEVGGPSLKDKIWLYGGDKAAIRRQIHQPQQGVMPVWGERLDDASIKMLTLYVHSLGGGR